MVAKARKLKAGEDRPHGVDIVALVSVALTIPMDKLNAALAAQQTQHENTGRPVFGTENRKTGSPGTYRQVGDSAASEGTCPSTCAHLQAGSCFGLSHHAAESAKRAGSSPAAALRSFAGATAIAVRRSINACAAAIKAGEQPTAALLDQCSLLSRLHVVGDLGGSDGQPDQAYIGDLCKIAELLRAHLRESLADLGFSPTTVEPATRYVSWAYTHFEMRPETFERIRSAGIALRRSDVLGPWGAITVTDREHARSLSSRRQVVAVCPAQLAEAREQTLTCADCGLCWSRPDLTIAFVAHGPGAKRAKRAYSGRSFSE